MVNIGVSRDHELEGGVVHFTGEGVLGAGGSVVGANIDCVSDSTAESTLGGIIKCIVSSLHIKKFSAREEMEVG